MRNSYSLSEAIKMAYSLILTKVTFPQARLVRRPVYVRGAKSIVGAQQLTTGRFCRFDLNGSRPTLFIGSHCEFGDMTHIVAHEKVEIGDNVLIASKCFISDTNHGEYKGRNQSRPDEPPQNRRLAIKPTIIGDNVWIGENSVILAGADIGDGCIIGANSVVSKVIPPNSIVVGANRIISKYGDG